MEEKIKELDFEMFNNEYIDQCIDEWKQTKYFKEFEKSIKILAKL